MNVISIQKVNANKENENKVKIENLSEGLFKKIFNLNSEQSPEILNFENKYYLAEITNTEKKNRDFNDPEVQQALQAQLGFKSKIEANTSIIKDLSMGALDKNNFEKFAS